MMILSRVLFILWFSVSLLSPHLLSGRREEDYISKKGSELVKLLKSGDREIRGRAFYELQRRQCPQAWKSYAEFKQDHKILDVIVCPSGKNTPLYLVLYDYQFYSSFPDQYYRMPDREIFEKFQDKSGLAWKNNMRTSIFDSTGGDVGIPGEYSGLYHGVIADINGDGFIEIVDAQRSRKKITGSPRATVLTVWVLKETPRCIFALMYNLSHGNWGYALEDKNNDGVFDILLGPGKPGTVTPMVTYKWDSDKGIYHGPGEGEDNQFRILDTTDIEEEGEETWTTAHITSGGPPQKQKPKNYNKPYQYVSLKNLSNREILEYMQDGNKLNSLEWRSLKPAFPKDFWQKPPKEAVLDLVNMNRHSEHKQQYQIAIDDSRGLEPPDQCRIFYSCLDNPYHTGYRAHYFIRCSPGESYLAYGVCSTSGLFYPAPRDQEAIFKFRLCSLPDKIASHFARSSWWLNRVRSRRQEEERCLVLSSFSTADGHGALEFKSGLSHIDFSITASDKAMSIAETWNGQYDKETCLNFFTYLLHYGLKEQLNACLDDSKPHLPGNDQRTEELAEFFMKNFSPDETRVSIPIVAEAVRYAGATASQKYLPLLEKIHQQLSRCAIPVTRTVKQVNAELRALEDKKQGPGNSGLNEKIKALKEEYKQVEVGSSAPVALDRLRQAIRQARKKITLGRDGAALEDWMKSWKEEAAWATRRLKSLYPQRYIKFLEQQIHKNKGRNAIDAFYQLKNFAPEHMVALSEKLLAEQRKDLFIPAFQVLVKAKIITNIENMLPELVEALTAADTEWNRGYLIDLLVPQDNPLKYKDERIDRALATLLHAQPGDERLEYILKDICLALARRGRIEYFFKIKEWFDIADTFSEKGEILLTLTYLALQGKSKYLTELEALLGRYLRKTNIKIGEVIRSIWAADFKHFKERLAKIATSSPKDYEDRAAYSSGSDKDVDGRYHMARKVCSLWNEQDPVTRCKLWIAFGLKDYYEIMKNPACILRMKEELSRFTSILTGKQKGEILRFIEFCYGETSGKWKRQSGIWEIMRKNFQN